MQKGQVCHWRIEYEEAVKKEKSRPANVSTNEHIYTLPRWQNKPKFAFKNILSMCILGYDSPAAGSLILVPQILCHAEQGKRQYTDNEDKNKS